MSRGRGKSAPDRSELLAATGVEIIEAQALPCPTSLPEYAAELWVHLTQQTFALKLIGPEDGFLLESLCMHYQIFCDARDSYTEQSRESRLRELTTTGWKRSSDIDIMAKASDQMIKIAKLMGITPLVRAQMNLNYAASAALMATTFPEKIKAEFEALHGNRR